MISDKIEMGLCRSGVKENIVSFCTESEEHAKFISFMLLQIKVIKDLPVGKNLQTHLVLGLL